MDGDGVKVGGVGDCGREGKRKEKRKGKRKKGNRKYSLLYRESVVAYMDK